MSPQYSLNGSGLFCTHNLRIADLVDLVELFANGGQLLGVGRQVVTVSTPGFSAGNKLRKL